LLFFGLLPCFVQALVIFGKILFVSFLNAVKLFKSFFFFFSASPREISSSFCFSRLSYISRFKFPGFVLVPALPRCASAFPRDHFVFPANVHFSQTMRYSGKH